MTSRGDDQIEALRDLAESVVAAREPEAVTDALVEAAHRALDIDQMHVTEVSQDFTVGHSHVVGFDAAKPQSERYVQVFDDRPSGSGKVVATGELVHIPDAQSAQDIRSDYVERFNARTILFVPVKWAQPGSAPEVRYVVILI